MTNHYAQTPPLPILTAPDTLPLCCISSPTPCDSLVHINLLLLPRVKDNSPQLLAIYCSSGDYTRARQHSTCKLREKKIRAIDTEQHLVHSDVRTRHSLSASTSVSPRQVSLRRRGRLRLLPCCSPVEDGLPRMKKRPSESVSNLPNAVRPPRQYHQRLLRLNVGSNPKGETFVTTSRAHGGGEGRGGGECYLTFRNKPAASRAERIWSRT
jgi:hypothetical protein